MRKILVIVLAGFLLLSGCSGYQYYPPSGTQPPETPSPTENQLSETPSPTPSIEVRPRLNVRIDYFGVKNAQGKDDLYPDGLDGEVQLLVVVSDGITNTTKDEVFIPSDGKGYEMPNFETKQINRRVFHTSSVGDYLRVSIIAWDIDSTTETLDLLSALEALGAPGAGELKIIIELLPQEDDRIGDYQHTWYPDEKWGIGQYEVSDGNFLVGFSIWSDEEPPLISQPPLSPDVKIQSVNMPIEVKNSSGLLLPYWYDNTFTIVNNEPVDVKIDWEAHSSVRGRFDGGSEIIPAKGSKSVTKSYFYTTAGLIEVTYTISHNGDELDSRSDTLNVIS